MARRREARRNSETDRLKNRFAETTGGARYARRARERSWEHGRYNSFTRALVQLWLSTGDPIFRDALEALIGYGLAEPKRNPSRRLKELEGIRINGHVSELIEDARKRHGSNISERRACEIVAALGAEGNCLETARVRVKKFRKQELPNGDIGRVLLVGRPELCAKCRNPLLRNGKGRAGACPHKNGATPHASLDLMDLEWLPSDRQTRLRVAAGEIIVIADQSAEDLDEPVLPDGTFSWVELCPPRRNQWATTLRNKISRELSEDLEKASRLFAPWHPKDQPGLDLMDAIFTFPVGVPVGDAEKDSKHQKGLLKHRLALLDNPYVTKGGDVEAARRCIKAQLGRDAG